MHEFGCTGIDQLRTDPGPLPWKEIVSFQTLDEPARLTIESPARHLPHLAQSHGTEVISIGPKQANEIADHPNAVL